jgi:predicted MPP superfamily phosphohydrolase
VQVQTTHILFFFFMTVGVLGGGHMYMWKRLIRDSHFPRRWHLGFTTGFFVLMVALPVLMIGSRQLPRESVSSLAFLAFTWLGLLSTYFTLLLPIEFGRFMTKWLGGLPLKRPGAPGQSPNPGEPTNPHRRRVMGRLLAGGVVATGTTLGGVAVKGALKGFSLAEVEVHLDRLPASFDGFRIVQLSDVHVGPTIGRDFVDAMVDAANSLSPDLIALTGDFVDGSVKSLSSHTAPLARLHASDGTYFVTGNHEYYSGVEDWLKEIERLGVTPLRNESRRIHRGTDSFLLAGVTDYRAESYGDAPDLKAALSIRSPGEEVVLLAHQPREVFRAEKEGVGLQLSGHTHGGQFWPWNWVIHLIEPVVSGLARFGRTQIYVNSGTGYWGPPMRLGTESEITLITLRSVVS